MSTEISTEFEVDKEARIDFESSFNITDGKELMDKLEAKHIFFPNFWKHHKSQFYCISACPFVNLQSKICIKNII